MICRLSEPLVNLLMPSFLEVIWLTTVRDSIETKVRGSAFEFSSRNTCRAHHIRHQRLGGSAPTEGQATASSARGPGIFKIYVSPQPTISGVIRASLKFVDAGEHFARVIGVGTAVPQSERTRKITVSFRKFRGECGAPDVKTYWGIAQRAQEVPCEAVLAGYLTHYLHQTPGNRARNFLRGW